MMGDEAALKLAEAINRIAAVLEAGQGVNGLSGGGFHVQHHGIQYYPQVQAQFDAQYNQGGLR